MRKASAAAAAIGECPPSGNDVQMPPWGQSWLEKHVGCAGAVQLFLQNVVVVGSPLGASMNVPQQTSSGPHLLVFVHSYCVVVVQAARSRHVPKTSPERQQVCPSGHRGTPYALQALGASGRSTSALIDAPASFAAWV